MGLGVGVRGQDWGRKVTVGVRELGAGLGLGFSPWKVSPRASSPTSTPAWSRLFIRAATLCGGAVRGRVRV